MRRFENRVLVGLRTSIAKIISMWADPGTRWISSQQYRNENHKSIHSFSHVKRFGSSPHAPMTRTGSSEPSYPRSPRRNRRERPGLGRPKRGRAERLLADQRRPGRSNALPRGVDGSGRADALSTDILKHRRGPRRRPQHRVGGGLVQACPGHPRDWAHGPPASKHQRQKVSRLWAFATGRAVVKPVFAAARRGWPGQAGQARP